MRRQRKALGLSLDDVLHQTGIAKGELSMFERGHSIPRDDQVAALRPVYGHPGVWYPPGVARVLMPDLRDCAGCGDELDPDASRSRIYHNDVCRAEARRKGAAL